MREAEIDMTIRLFRLYERQLKLPLSGNDSAARPFIPSFLLSFLLSSFHFFRLLFLSILLPSTFRHFHPFLPSLPSSLPCFLDSFLPFFLLCFRPVFLASFLSSLLPSMFLSFVLSCLLLGSFPSFLLACFLP
jgi:hypothetical protein